MQAPGSASRDWRVAPQAQQRVVPKIPLPFIHPFDPQKKGLDMPEESAQHRAAPLTEDQETAVMERVSSSTFAVVTGDSGDEVEVVILNGGSEIAEKVARLLNQPSSQSTIPPAPTEPEVKVMSPSEFRAIGFLQEINRLFLHPRGLALEVVVGDGPERLGRIWDYREDPEGVVFGGEPGSIISATKAEAVERQFQVHLPAREALLGRAVQAVGGEVAPEVTKTEEKES